MRWVKRRGRYGCSSSRAASRSQPPIRPRRPPRQPQIRGGKRGSSGASAGGTLDGTLNPLIGSTAADIGRHERGNLLLAWVRCFREQGGGRHDLSALAVAALRNLF